MSSHLSVAKQFFNKRRTPKNYRENRATARVFSWSPATRQNGASLNADNCIQLTISVRQAAVAAQHTMTFQYERPLEWHS